MEYRELSEPKKPREIKIEPDHAATGGPWD